MFSLTNGFYVYYYREPGQSPRRLAVRRLLRSESAPHLSALRPCHQTVQFLLQIRFLEEYIDYFHAISLFINKDHSRYVGYAIPLILAISFGSR